MFKNFFCSFGELIIGIILIRIRVWRIGQVSFGKKHRPLPVAPYISDFAKSIQEEHRIGTIIL